LDCSGTRKADALIFYGLQVNGTWFVGYRYPATVLNSGANALPAAAGQTKTWTMRLASEYPHIPQVLPDPVILIGSGPYHS
jgi:hypothetical protein